MLDGLIKRLHASTPCIFHHPYVLDLQPAPTLICTTLAGASLGTALCWDPRALSVIHQLRAKHAGIHHYHPLVFLRVALLVRRSLCSNEASLVIDISHVDRDPAVISY